MRAQRWLSWPSPSVWPNSCVATRVTRSRSQPLDSFTQLWLHQRGQPTIEKPPHCWAPSLTITSAAEADDARRNLTPTFAWSQFRAARSTAVRYAVG